LQQFDMKMDFTQSLTWPRFARNDASGKASLRGVFDAAIHPISPIAAIQHEDGD